MSALDMMQVIAMSPLLAIAVIFAHYYVRRAVWKHRRRLGIKNLGFCPSMAAMGTSFQFIEVFYRPNMAYVLEAKLDEEVDEDDSGDPETPATHFNRQLRRIRRGENVETLVLRL
jgi:hypothetical protein